MFSEPCVAILLLPDLRMFQHGPAPLSGGRMRQAVHQGHGHAR